MDRKRFSYTATLQNSRSGEIVEHVVETYWSPSYDGVEGAVGDAARIEVSRATGVEHATLAVTAP